jgi:hypothetical protein
MRVEIKRIDVASLVKICFVIYAILGMIVGFVYVVFALVFSSFLDLAGASEGTALLKVAATGAGILLVPLFALFYGIFGSLAGLVGAVVYNLVSKALGGLRLTLEAEGTEAAAPGSINQVDMRL